MSIIIDEEELTDADLAAEVVRCAKELNAAISEAEVGGLEVEISNVYGNVTVRVARVLAETDVIEALGLDDLDSDDDAD